jgi:hypothetical protein
MSDLSFVDRLPEICARRQHYADVVREVLRRKIELVQNDFDEAVDRARDLMKAGGDITDELKALEGYGHSLLMVVGLLRREAEKASAVCVQTQPERTSHESL